MIIIGDIAGQFDGLMRLVGRFPGEEIVLVGDLVDRGPNSKEVIQWAIDNKIKTCLGNHEHMMIDFYRGKDQYDNYIWHMNGGGMTSQQYKDDPETLENHLQWLESLPYFYRFDGLLVSHAAWNPALPFSEACDTSDFLMLGNSLLWNRGNPAECDEFQVFGHNSHWGLTWFGDKENPWGVCIDDSQKGLLTAFQWPEKRIFQEPYLLSDKYENTRLINADSKGSE